VVKATFTAVAAIAALHACASPPADGRQAEAQAAVAALEKKVSLPDASRTLAGYDRYYAISKERIEAVYLSSARGSGRVHLVDRSELPKAKEEGCAAVNIVFDRKGKRFGRILCNGVRLTERSIDIRLPVAGAPGGERG
jgi:hypothetical protein